MDYSFSELLSDIPNDVFFNKKGKPDFNAIFVAAARRIYGQRGDGFSLPAADFLSKKLPNLTSFQRAVTKERKRRAS